MWIYTGQSVIGTSHRKGDIPCQDFHKIEILDDYLIAVISDGAGSAKYADTASRLIAEDAVYIIKDWLSNSEISVFTDKEGWTGKVKNLIEILRDKLKAKSKEAECDLREFSATFLLVVVSPQWIFGAQIGDGAIIYGTKDDNELHLLTHPTTGEYINETTFITSSLWEESLQINFLTVEVDKLSLFCLCNSWMNNLTLNSTSHTFEISRNFLQLMSRI